MGLWIAYLLLGVLAGLLLAYPLLRRKGVAPAAKAETTPTAEAADPVDAARPTRKVPTWAAPAAGVAAILAAAGGLYAATDDKAAPMQVEAAGMGMAAGGGAGAMLPDVDTMIGRLAERLKANPKDGEGWRMLGWSYVATGRYKDALEPYSKAMALLPKDAALRGAYGEAQVKASGDKVTPEAEKSFRQALDLDPKEPRARVYLARLDHQNGQSKKALDTLFEILAATPKDSQMQPVVTEAIRLVAKESGVDVSGRLPAAPVGPTQADIAAAQALSPDQQQSMVDGMVARLEARLEASPRDADGWVMLMRSRKKLGQDAMAKAAFDKALTVFKEDAAATQQLKAAAKELGVG